MWFSHFYLVKQVSNVTEINQHQQLEITVYKDELKRAQQNIQFFTEKNRELRGQNNFLESQNKMLMDKEAEER
jgi:predicted RNase H-like nuclease (RuvC/YqgF family)